MWGQGKFVLQYDTFSELCPVFQLMAGHIQKNSEELKLPGVASHPLRNTQQLK